MSGCTDVAQIIGLAIDSDPATPRVPDVCCTRCHERKSCDPLVIGGVTHCVCCGVRHAYYASLPGKGH